MRSALLFAIGISCGIWLGIGATMRRAGSLGARAAQDVTTAELASIRETLTSLEAASALLAGRMVRGIRGATTVPIDEPHAILSATSDLLEAIVARNSFDSRDVAAALFTVTPDLHSEFPAAAARGLGWTQVPLLNFTEIGVPGRLARVVRTLVLVNSTCAQDEVEHVYLGEAQSLRPDLASRSAQ